jgi:hypothetical protein
MTINLSDFLNKEVTVELLNGKSYTGTITSSFGVLGANLYAIYPYFMDAPTEQQLEKLKKQLAQKAPTIQEAIDVILTWTNTGRWNTIRSEYDIVSIVETSPKQMNNKQQLLQSIKDTEQQLEKLKKQLTQKAPTIQEAEVGDVLEDGSIVIKKENGLALVVAPKSTEVKCQWTKQFSEVYSKLNHFGFIPSQWFVPTVEQLALAYKVIPDEFNKEWYWSSSEYNASTSWIINSKGGTQFSLKSHNCHVRSVRCISY